MKKFLLAVLFLYSYQSVTPQEKLSLQINGGPLIVDREDSNLGYGASASLLYHLSEKFDLSLRSGYLNWSIEDTRNNETGRFYSIPVLAGARYYFLKDKIQPYVSIEGGINYTHVDFNNEINFWGISQELQTNSSSTGYSFGLGIGFNYVLTERIGLDVQAATQHQETSFEYLHMQAGISVGL